VSESAERPQRLRIGELLVNHGLISVEQLETALEQQRKLGLKLGQTVVELGYVAEEQLMDLIARQLRLRRVDLGSFRPDPEVVKLLSETHSRRFRAVVLEDRGHELLVGMADPSDVIAFDELARILKRRLRAAIVREKDAVALIERVFRDGAEQLHSLAVELHEELGESSFDVAKLGEGVDAGDTAVVRLIQQLFEDAVRLGVSDIHIEPDETVLRIRQRIDGMLHENVMRERRIAPALVLRLKLMASLDISERRLPQDGRFNVRVGERSIDVRMSTMPIQHGESVVMRLLDHAMGARSLDELGLPAPLLERLRVLIRRPHGLIVVTGPTGSGKTTTLYSALREVDRPETKIITVEDPVEYRLPRINQVQVNPKIELDFARVLRSALRQDPDIVMVGEMRDSETAEIALRASLTGHLVFSTLHTNDAPSAPVRLADMGVEGFLIATALRAVVAQRLVRLCCASCAEAFRPDARELAWLRVIRPELAPGAEFRRGRGCDECQGTGYRGRRGVYELLELGEAASDALRRGDAAEYARVVPGSRGYRPLVQEALDLALAGSTSIDEVFRVAGELEDAA
jgi:MSHA biogenesis protein MshE